MLVSLDVTSPQGAVLHLPLEDVEDGIIVADIQGLDPVKATLVSSGFADADGEQFESARREKRNLKIQLELDPDPAVESVASVRNRLYGFFMPKSVVTLRFFLEGGLDLKIEGRVESCEQVMFSEEPMMDITILCFDPDFLDDDTVVVNANTTNTTSGSTGLVTVEYPGSTETGMVFTLNVNRSLSQFTIYHNDGTQVYTLDFAASLVAGDVVTISTVAGNKFATLLRAGVTSSLLYAVSPQSKWLELERGTNLVRFYATGAAIPYSLSYQTRYGAL